MDDNQETESFGTVAPSQPNISFLPLLLKELRYSTANPILNLLLGLIPNRIPDRIVRPLLGPNTGDSEGEARTVMGGEDGHLTLRPLTEEEDTDVEASRKGSYASYV